ncbi:MAG: NUDIX domain-containing protein [Capsulimonadales bacterium]|nr:NUDIX domain-containing protein [Capsulimonadales bacterium]
MATTARRGKAKKTMLPPGAWHVLEAIWGESQRVRLVTGLPSLVTDTVHIRSIHLVGFVSPEQVLLVQNRDGSFTFPGGRLEGNETLDGALHREVWEEARATIAPGYRPVAATRIEFLNRVPGRVYRVHPSYISWVVGQVDALADEPCLDPAEGVIDRLVTSITDAMGRLGPLEQRVLEGAIRLRDDPGTGSV